MLATPATKRRHETAALEMTVHRRALKMRSLTLQSREGFRKEVEKSVRRANGLAELGKQGGGFAQVASLKAFTKPAVNLGKEAIRFGAFLLALPKTA